jgi:DNA-binding Lrp family transcriptional regulator
MKSDTKDLLAILQKNPRAKLTGIARELGVSVTAVKKRIEGLEKKGIIKGYRAEIDYSKLNYALCAFVGVAIEPKKKEQVMEELSNIREVTELYDITGSFDALAKVYCRSMEDLRGLLAFTIGGIDGVRSTTTMMALKERDISIKLLED